MKIFLKLLITAGYASMPILHASEFPSSINNRHGDVFYFDKNMTFKEPIKINNSHNITIDGNGSSILCLNPSKGLFEVKDSTGIVFKNFSVDYSIVPHVAGKIQLIDKKKDKIIFDPFPYYRKNLKKNLQYLPKKILYIYPLTSPGKVKYEGTPVSFIRHVSPLKRGRYLLTMEGIRKNLNVHDAVAIVFRKQGSPVFKIKHTSNITFKNITVYASPVTAFVFKNVSSCYIDSLKIILKKKRWISVNAGGLHFQSSRGNIKIINSTIEGAGDDLISLYTIPFNVIKHEKKRLLLGPKEARKMIKEGDSLVFFDRSSQKIITVRKIDKVHKADRGVWVYLKKIPRMDKNILVYDKALNIENVHILNNDFYSSRRHGIFLKATDVEIKGNNFSFLGGNAVAIHNEIKKYREGIISNNIKIIDNNMHDCGFGLFTTKALINIGSSGYKKRSFLQQNIIIRKNRMINKDNLFDIHNAVNISIEQ